MNQIGTGERNSGDVSTETFTENIYKPVNQQQKGIF